MFKIEAKAKKKQKTSKTYRVMTKLFSSYLPSSLWLEEERVYAKATQCAEKKERERETSRRES